MELTQSINMKNRLVTLSIEGDICARDICSAADQMIENPEFKKDFNSLWDFSKSRIIDPSPRFVSELLSYAESVQDKRGKNYKVAIIAKDDLLFGYARMYATYAYKLPCRVIIFRDTMEAFQWVFC